jgi:alpha-glucosidase
MPHHFNRVLRLHTTKPALFLYAEESACVSVSALTPSLIRVRYAPGGQFAPRRSWDGAKADDEFAATAFMVDEQPETIVLRTSALNVRVEKSTGHIAFADLQGRVFAEDTEPVSVTDQGPRIVKRIAAGEHFYGFGERAGLLEKTGRRYTNWTSDPPFGHDPGVDPMYMAIPVFLAVRPGLSYGVFFHNTFRSVFDVGHTHRETLVMEAEGGEADYYIAYGPRPAEVLRTLTDLLGRMPLPPRWALGHHQSRWGYKSAEEILALADEFRARDLPGDAFHLDIDYMRGYRVFTWDADRFPDPAGFISALRDRHFRAVTIIDPGVKADDDYAVYQQGIGNDFFIRKADGEVAHGYVWPDDSVFADFVRPEVRAWWGQLLRMLTDHGVSGIWNDMNEPVVFNKPFSEGGGGAGTLPLDAVQGPDDERTTHAEVHNLYGLSMSRAAYEGLRALRPQARPFTLTRSAYAGIQRWSAGWMGDNNSWWEHLEMCLPQLMNMGLSGVAFVGVDIGGFFDNCTPELMARWSQIGALMPFCRNHACNGTALQEPWRFGPHVEGIYRSAMKLRYRLLPYLYSVFWEATQTGAPVWRPLFYHFPDDIVTYHLHDQVMVGPALMAAPVMRPGRTHRAVYLPAGEWFDWHTGERFTGPTHVLAPAPLEQMPLYAHAGSLVPLGPELRYTDEKPLSPLTLRVFPGEGEFALYEDDGHSLAYENGEWCLTRFTLWREGATWKLAMRREGQHVPPKRSVIIEVVGGETVSVEDDGQEKEVQFGG